MILGIILVIAAIGYYVIYGFMAIFGPATILLIAGIVLALVFGIKYATSNEWQSSEDQTIIFLI